MDAGIILHGSRTAASGDPGERPGVSIFTGLSSRCATRMQRRYVPMSENAVRSTRCEPATASRRRDPHLVEPSRHFGEEPGERDELSGQEEVDVLAMAGVRPRQTLGWWERFQIADGPVATAARFLVAAAIIGCVVWVGRLA